MGVYDLMARAKWNDKGLDEFIAAFSKTDDRNMEEIAGTALYAMAKVAADAVKANLNALTTEQEEPWKGHRHQHPSQRQKDGLISGFGIAKKQASGGGWNVRLGFDGYNAVKTKKYPNGQPNAMIARSVESGSEWMIKQPFFRNAINASKAAAKKAGEDAVIGEFDKIF